MAIDQITLGQAYILGGNSTIVIYSSKMHLHIAEVLFYLYREYGKISSSINAAVDIDILKKQLAKRSVMCHSITK